MNTIDLVVYLVLALALFEGWRRGAILQICSLAGLVAGIWLAARYGAAVGTWLGIDPAASAAGGFAAVLVATVIAVAVLARIPDILLGIAVAVLKYLLLLSVAFAALESLNADYGLVNRETVVSSRWFGPVRGLSDRLLPFLDWVGDRIPA